MSGFSRSIALLACLGAAMRASGIAAAAAGDPLSGGGHAGGRELLPELQLLI